MTTIQRHLVGRLLVTTLIVVPGICVPITMIALFKEVPTALLYSKAIWTILNGIVPLEFYLILPVGVAIAVTWWYDTLVSDYAVDVLYSSGYSPLAVIMPAIVVALVSIPLGVYVSCVVAPQGATRLYDLVYEFRHNLHPSVLEAQKFYHLEDPERTLSFERWLDKDSIGGVFLREVMPDKEWVIVADKGQFFETEGESYLYLLEGVIQTIKRGDSQPTIIKFDRLWKSIGLRGSSPPRRNWSDASELGPIAFLAAFKDLKNDRKKTIRWANEALKRFGAPFLTIVYTLVGLGLLLPGLGIRRGAWWRVQAICAFLAINHAVIMLMADGMTSIDARIAWIIVFAMAAELIAGIALVSFSTFMEARLPFAKFRAPAQ